MQSNNQEPVLASSRRRARTATTDFWPRGLRFDARCAFTMIELLLVLVLLVTAASLALPTFTALISRNDDQQAIATVRRSLQTARQLAIDTGTAQYWQPEIVSSTADIDAAIGAMPSSTISKSSRLKSGYSATVDAANISTASDGATQSIVFLPTGSANDGRIVVHSPHGEVAALLVIGATGSILNEDAAQ